MVEPRRSSRWLVDWVVLGIAAAAVGILLLLVLWPARDPVAIRELPPELDPAIAGEELPPSPELPPGGVAEFEGRIQGMLGRDRPRTQPLVGPLRIRAADIRLDDPARAQSILRVEAASGLLELPRAPGQPMVVRSLVLTGPELRLTRPGPGRAWNIEHVLERPLAPAPSPRVGPGPAVMFRDVTIRRGHVDVRDGGDLWVLRDLQANIASAALPPGPGAGVNIVSLAGFLRVPDQDVPSLALTVERAALTLPANGMALRAARVGLGETVVAGLDASLDPDRPGLGLRASGTVTRLRFRDVAFLSEALPPGGSATFAFNIESIAAERFLVQLDDLDARANGSHVTGALRVALGGELPPDLRTADLRLSPLELATLEPFTGPLPYGGTLSGTARTVAGDLVFDVEAVLTSPGVAEPFRTDLAGRVAITPDGFTLRRLEAVLYQTPLIALREIAPALPFTGAVSGRVALTGPPGDAPLALDVALDFAGGTLALDGTVDLTGAVPGYDLVGRVSGVQLRQLLEPSAPPIVMNATFTARGRGLDPATANVRLAGAGTLHGWHTRPGDALRVEAALANGTLALDTLSVTAGPVRLASGGHWRFIEPEAGSLRYTLNVSDLHPLTPYLPGTNADAVTGQLATTGNLSGTLDRPVLTGQADGREVRWGAWRAHDFRVQYMAGLGVSPPRMTLSFAGRGVEAPFVGSLATAALELQLTEPSFAIDFRGSRPAGGVIELAADGTLLEGPGARATLRHFTIDTEGERWALVSPAIVNIGSDPLELDVVGLEVRQQEGPGALVLNGRLLPAEQAALRADIRALPLGELLDLGGAATRVEGRLWATLELTGALGAPRLASEFRFEHAIIGGVALTEFTGSVRYDGAMLSARATMLPVEGGRAEVEGSIQARITLALPPTVDIADDAIVFATAVIDSLPLAVLEPGIPAIADMAGVASGRVTVAGRQDAPELAGELYIRDGEARILALDQRYRQIEGDFVLEGRRLLVPRLRARSDGWVTLSGAIEFQELANPTTNLTFSFERFRALGVEDQTAAALWGEVFVRGPLRLPTITGSVVVGDGGVSLPAGTGAPDFAFDEPFGVLPADPGAPILPGAIAPTAPWLRGFIVDGLHARIGSGVWFVSREARLQLSGDLTIHRDLEAIRIFGDLEGERGTFTLQVGPLIRRFDIVQAHVRFFGVPGPDPAIDVTASRLIFGPGGTEIEVLARVGGTVSRPTLTLATGTGVPIPESELLSFLLFGQPSFALGEVGLGGGGVFEGLIAGGLLDFAAIELEHALIEGLGLPFDFVQIRPGQGAFGLEGATLVVGREIGRDLFLTVDAGLAGLFGDAPARDMLAIRMEWRIDREWRLRLGLEPVDRTRFFNIDVPTPTGAPNQQFTVEIRRRWTY